jgi:hypothetical protein
MRYVQDAALYASEGSDRKSISMIVRKIMRVTKYITGKMKKKNNPTAVSATPIETSNMHGTTNKEKLMMISIPALRTACSKCI